MANQHTPRDHFQVKKKKHKQCYSETIKRSDFKMHELIVTKEN